MSRDKPHDLRQLSSSNSSVGTVVPVTTYPPGSMTVPSYPSMVVPPTMQYPTAAATTMHSVAPTQVPPPPNFPSQATQPSIMTRENTFADYTGGYRPRGCLKFLKDCQLCQCIAILILLVLLIVAVCLAIYFYTECQKKDEESYTIRTEIITEPDPETVTEIVTGPSDPRNVRPLIRNIGTSLV